MLSTSEKKALDKGMITAWIIWAALLFSLCLYVLVCHSIDRPLNTDMHTNSNLIYFKYLLYLIAAIELIFSYFIRKIILKAGSGNIKSIHASESKPLDVLKAVGRYILAMLITLSISESIGIYGMVLFMVGGDFQTLYTFIGVSALAMFFYRPKKDEIITVAENMRTRSAQQIVS